jgi:hypothetical protein
MTDDDLYRRNPARDIEKLAVRIVGSWLGARGEVRDTSAGHEPDFEIAYVDGRYAIGEVGWHEDPEIRAMWSIAFRQKIHQQIDLPSGRGQWGVTLVRGARIKDLYRKLPSVIDSMLQAGTTRLEIVGTWPRGELPDALRALGIEYINQVNSHDPSAAIFFMPNGGGSVPPDPNVVADWVESVLGDPDYADTTAKLLCRDADEKHVFLMSGTQTEFGHAERLRRVGEELPSRAPLVPEGITHVWCISEFGDGVAALWEKAAGWSAIPSLEPGERM